MKRANRWRRAPGWWWRGPCVGVLLVATGGAIALTAAAVGATWNTLIGMLR